MSLPLLGPDTKEPGVVGRRVERLRTAVRRSGLLKPTTFKVAVFAVVCLVVLAVLAAKIGNIDFFAHRVQYQAELTDATGLQPSADVKIAGVTVGVVDSVAVRHGHALVSFSLNHGVRLPTDTQVGMQWQNVLGDEYLYLYPGHAATMLHPGATIGLANDVSSPNIGALLNALGPLLGAIHPQQANQVVVALANALQGNETQIDDLINSAATVSDTVGSVSAQVGALVTNLNQVFSALAQRSGDLGTLIDNLDTVTQSLASNNSLLDQTVSNLGKASAEVATLVANTHGTLSGAIDNLQSVSKVIEQNDTDLGKGLAGLGSGLAPYTEISDYGQWFQIRGVYTCLAGQAACSYYDSNNPPKGSGLGGAPPTPGVPSLPSLPGNGSASSSGAGLPAANPLSSLFAPLAGGTTGGGS